MDPVGRFYAGSNVSKKREEKLLETKSTATPESFFFQQRRKHNNEAAKMNNPIIRYARIKSVRYNLDVRLDQLERMRREMEEALHKRPAETHEEHQKRMERVRKQQDEEMERPLGSLTKKVKKPNRVKYNNVGEAGFYLNKLAKAIESEDSAQVNRAVLISFFEELAPERLEEVDDLLAEYKGREEELFKELGEKYPVPKAEDIVTSDEDKDALVEMKEIIDKSFEDKKDGKFIVHLIKEQGGAWFVNRQKPSQHPSQRKRETLLENLRNHSV